MGKSIKAALFTTHWMLVNRLDKTSFMYFVFIRYTFTTRNKIPTVNVIGILFTLRS